MFMVDRFGLLTDGMPNLLPFQNKLVQKREQLQSWDTTSEALSLLDVVRNVKPNILTASRVSRDCSRKRLSARCTSTARGRS